MPNRPLGAFTTAFASVPEPSSLITGILPVCSF
jgi:hypothetical protein